MEEYRHQSDAEIKQHDLKKNLILPSSVNQTHIYYEQKKCLLTNQNCIHNEISHIDTNSQ